MSRFFKTTVLGVAVAATTALAAVPAANAGHRWHHHHHHHNGDAVVAGVLGLAAGAVLGGALAQPAPTRVYRYYAPPPPPPVYHYRESSVVYYDRSYEPWTPAWYRACEIRYRSFDPVSGTYMGYDGVRHFCTP